MLNISVRNYRGVASADITHDKLTLIAGKNHHGKSSIAEATAAVLTGNVLPIQDLLKSQADKIVREGAKAGSCKIIDGQSVALISWPDCNFTAEGPAMKNISRTAAGLASILELKKKERADYLAPFLKAEPTQDDIAKELKALDFPAEIISKLQEAVKISGIHNVYLKAKETGTSLKGKWEITTGEKFGYARIEGWMPGKWYAALSARTEPELVARVEELKRSVEAGIAAEAVAGLEVEQIQTAAAALPALQKDLAATKKKYLEAQEKEAKLNSTLQRLSAMPEELACPHCGGLLQMKNGKLEISKGLDDQEIQDRVQRIKEVGDDLQTARAELEKIRVALNGFESGVKTAQGAADQLEAVKAAGTQKYTKILAEQRQLLQAAENDLQAFQVRAKATTIAGAIKQNKIISDLLAPTGLRETKLKAALVPFNKSLSALSEAAGFGNVRLDQEMDVLMNGRPAALCSTSEQYQIKTIFQLVIAQLEAARLVLVDGADIIVGRERNGLVQAILAAGIPAIIFMSMNQRENMPPLDKVGGVCYWIEEGEIKT